MRGERRQHHVRLDDPAQVLVESGLVDVDYVAAQLGTGFSTPYEAARAAVQAGDVSPHPLFEAQWIGHIPAQRPGLAPYANAVERALTDPTFVRFDADHADRECFYRMGALPAPLDRLSLKVVVAFAAAGGTVLTVYPTDRLKRGEAPRWP